MVSSDTPVITSNPKKTQELILETAKSLMKLAGYKRMTMDTLAKEAGLGKGTLYLYFRSKEEVALSVIDLMNERLRARLRAIIDSKQSTDARLRLMLKERVLFRFDATRGYTQGIDDLLDSLRDALRVRREYYHDLEVKLLMEVLIEGKVKGEFSMEEPFDVARAMVAATNSLLPYSICCRELGSREQLEQLIDSICDLMLFGICGTKQPPGE